MCFTSNGLVGSNFRVFRQDSKLQHEISQPNLPRKPFDQLGLDGVNIGQSSHGNDPNTKLPLRTEWVIILVDAFTCFSSHLYRDASLIEDLQVPNACNTASEADSCGRRCKSFVKRVRKQWIIMIMGGNILLSRVPLGILVSDNHSMDDGL